MLCSAVLCLAKSQDKKDLIRTKNNNNNNNNKWGGTRWRGSDSNSLLSKGLLAGSSLLQTFEGYAAGQAWENLIPTEFSGT